MAPAISSTLSTSSPVTPVIDDFRERATRKADERRSGEHGFDGDQTERLLPFDRTEQRARAAEQLDLVLKVGLAHQVDAFLRESGSDLALVVVMVVVFLVNPAGQHDGHAGLGARHRWRGVFPSRRRTARGEGRILRLATTAGSRAHRGRGE